MKIFCFLQEKKGFTLLELIMVVVIIGILARIALPMFARVAERSRSAEGKMILINLRTAQLRYYADYGYYTNNLNDLDLAYSTLKYFNYIGAIPGTSGQLGQANRTGGAANTSYILSIYNTGNIQC